MGVVSSFAFAVLFLSANGPVTVHVGGAPKLLEAVKGGLLRERPALVLAADAASADLALSIQPSGDAWVLVVTERGRVLETRQLDLPLVSSSLLIL